MMPRKERLPKNVSSFIDRHGKLRYRFRKAGLEPRSFKHHPNSKDGKAELALFRKGKSPEAVERYQRGTVGWLAAIYRTSLAFTAGKGPDSLRNSWAILEKFVGEFKDDRIADFKFSHIEAILLKAAKKRKAGKRTVGGPHAALNLRGELLPFFNFALKHELITVNPVDHADKPEAPRTDGFHTWTDEEIVQYREHWPLGTKARLAMEIGLWTGLRKGDVSTFGRQHMKDGQIEVETSKTGQGVWLPVAPQLLAAIEAMPVVGTDTYLVTSFGKPFSKAGLGNKMREWCDAAGLPGCTMHGLRKALARLAAEYGATNAGLKALGGWRTDSQVSKYTVAADRKRLAGQAMAPVIAGDLANHGGTK